MTLIEPGGFRTDWAGSSITVGDIPEAYRPTVHGRRRLGFLLGSDAYALARAADEARIASDEEWKELTLSTDSDEATPQLATMRGAIR